MKTQQTATMAAEENSEMLKNATAAAGFLKGLANPNRLILLCLLADGEKSVSELEDALDLRQPAVSQQLARLRADGLVSTRRDGRTVYYVLASQEARQVIALLYELFCAVPGGKPGQQQPGVSEAAE